MPSTDSLNLIVENEIQQPLVTDCAINEILDEDARDAHIPVPLKPFPRIILYTISNTLLVVEFSIALQRQDSSYNLHRFTVYWCIGLWVISSRLFLKTVAEWDSAVVNSIPEFITIIFMIMIVGGWLECAFLAIVLSVTLLSLYVVAHSLYNLI